jgi:major membrane immunogen (membrane-anchored lipoprotein)
MKTFRILTTFIVALTVLLVSCSKDDNPTPENPATSDFFQAKVDNQSFPKAEIEWTKAKFVSSTKMIQIIGQPSDQKETIVLTIMDFSGNRNTAADWKPGTYDFNPIHISNGEYFASAEYNKWNGNGYDQWFTQWDYVKTGKIVIESNSGSKIKGTFVFDAVRRNNDGTFNPSSIKKITEGKFNLDVSTL